MTGQSGKRTGNQNHTAAARDCRTEVEMVCFERKSCERICGCERSGRKICYDLVGEEDRETGRTAGTGTKRGEKRRAMMLRKDEIPFNILDELRGPYCSDNSSELSDVVDKMRKLWAGIYNSLKQLEQLEEEIIREISVKKECWKQLVYAYQEGEGD